MGTPTHTPSKVHRHPFQPRKKVLDDWIEQSTPNVQAPSPNCYDPSGVHTLLKQKLCWRFNAQACQTLRTPGTKKAIPPLATARLRDTRTMDGCQSITTMHLQSPTLTRSHLGRREESIPNSRCQSYFNICIGQNLKPWSLEATSQTATAQA